MSKFVDNNSTVGIAGEFFVAAELTRRGYVASLTGKNTKAIDILASSKDGSRAVSIQVKTSNNAKANKWMMNENAETLFSDNLFYVFVNMREGQMPDYYIIPSTFVAQKIREEHQLWLNTPGRNGQKHNPTSMRTFTFSSEAQMLEYKDAWGLLGL
jgi:hypothetical protein